MEYREFLGHILLTAVDSNMAWAETRNYQVYHGADDTIIDATVEINANNGFGYQSVNTATVFQGIQTVKNPDFRINPAILETIRKAEREHDADAIDTNAANAIIQAGMFGILVYS